MPRLRIHELESVIVNLKQIIANRERELKEKTSATPILLIQFCIPFHKFYHSMIKLDSIYYSIISLHPNEY